MSKKLLKLIDHNIERIISAAIVVAMIVLLSAGAKASYMQADPLFGARTGYSDATSNEQLYNLISDYYDDYSNKKIKDLKKIATPISEMEESYIKFMSDYIDRYDVLEIYSKPGLTEGSFLVSVYVDVFFKGMKNPSPGLDFFYVSKNDEGNLYIDNRYSAFNQLYEEEETEAEVQALYDEFEIQEDVNLLRIRIQNDYNSLIASDGDFSVFINSELPQAATQWATDYQAAIDAAIAEEEARIAAEEEAARVAAEEEAARLAAEEAERQKAEEMANAVQMITLSKVNIRRSADENSEQVGYADPDTVVVKYYDEGDWSVIDYWGEKCYIKSEYLAPYEG